uniref:Homologous recombination OB-fold protein OB-fold domain-containing protein n=1 Tax=Tanacetum cinerariifolium TaxID=118510 RepID=A0A6L2KPA3_TANCI|nr:hypothetical protein [Tanacetum cinerariifolium]
MHGPPGIVQLSSSTRIEPSSSTSNPVRIIPGPKVVEDVGEDADFNSGVWVSATNYVIAFGGTVTGCLGDIDNFFKKGKLEQVVAIVKSCYPNALGDLNVTLKDLSGTVPETIHYKVLDAGSYGKNITIGAAMILANVLVFTPKPSEHYLNITKINVFEKEEQVGLLINSPGGSSTTNFSQATSSSPSLSPTPSITPIYYRGSSTNTECSNCKHLLGRIKVLQATLEMYRHPEQHTLNSAALLHDLNNDMEKLGLE